MERVNYNSIKLFEYLDQLNPQNSGIFFSILLHLVILLFAVGLPNFFAPKEVSLPNIIPIEILNVTETTNVEKSNKKNDENSKTVIKQKKFNSSENTEIQKQLQVKENFNTFTENNQATIEIKEKNKLKVEEKKNIEIKQKEIQKEKKNIETLATKKIKPKLKPEQVLQQNDTELNNQDIQVKPKTKKVEKVEKKDVVTQPRPKPKEDFSIASMLKDLRNEKSNNIIDEESVDQEQDKSQNGENENNENMTLSISEIDLLLQQLSSCWNAPAGAVINVGDKVTISAKIQKNMKVLENSVRILDTNISKSNPFYGPITDSAMRTLLNPECTPLKLPEDKYDLWKNLTISFDYSIMRGY